MFGGGRPATTVPAGGVTGVAAGSNTAAGVRCRPAVAGSFGVLTLNADGTYSYDGNPNVVPPAGATDTFVYTITDGDGDTSTTTLTITRPTSAWRRRTTTRRERGCAGEGSNPGSTAETVTGTVADNVRAARARTPMRCSAPGRHARHADVQCRRQLQLHADLDGTGRVGHNGITTENNVETFTYQVTDANGNTTTNTITIDVTDDVPTSRRPTTAISGEHGKYDGCRRRCEVRSYGAAVPGTFGFGANSAGSLTFRRKSPSSTALTATC